MKKKIIGILITMLLIDASVILVIDASTNTKETIYNITIGPYEITNDENGLTKFTMLAAGYGILNSPGDPAVPEQILEYQVPNTIDWNTVDVTINIKKSTRLEGIFTIAPCPPLEITTDITSENSISSSEEWGYQKIIVDKKNNAVYTKNSLYPEQSIEQLPYTEKKIPTESGFELVKYLRFAYRPFQYNPLTQEIWVTEQAEIHISYNQNDVRKFSQAPLPLSTYDYVIVTTNAIKANSQRLQDFVHLKELYGKNVLIITEDDYGTATGQPPNGRAEKIRQWLKTNDVGYAIDYVLLIGDPDPDDPLDPADHIGDIPMKMCMPNYFSYADRNCPTDYFYADLSGNWDLDGDGYFGENFDRTHPTSPDSSINSDYFSIRWTGYVKCDYTEEYEFHTWSDGGIKVFLDGASTAIINNWDTSTEHPPTNDYATKTMSAGWHQITVEYKEHTGDAIMQLFWKTNVPSTDPHYVGHDIIPLDHLKNETQTSNGLTGRYYNNIYFSGTPNLFHPNSEVINYLWGTGDLGAGGPDPGAEVFVGRIPVYSNDYAQLDSILGKIIDYETDPGNILWRKTLLLPMQPLWADTPAWHLGEGIKNNYAVAAGFSCFRIYEEDYASSGGPTPELWPCNKTNCVNEWKKGYGMVTFDTHGSSEDAVDIINSVDCPSLDDSKPCFAYLTACNNGYPESSTNLGYALLKHGGIATMAASRVTYGQHGEWWTFDPHSSTNHHMAYFYTKYVIDKFTLISLPAGAAAYVVKGDIPTIDHNSINYNLYGDPNCYLKITIPNLPPVANAGTSYSAEEGTMVTFDASSSYDPESYVMQYRWDIDNDGSWDTAWLSTPTYTHTWCDDYSGMVKLEVKDQLGKTDDDTKTVTISNVPPTANAGIDHFTNEGTMIQFTGSYSDPGCDTHTIEWDFGDGRPTTTGILTPNHAYGDNGIYTVTLTVEDDDGGLDTDTCSVTVNNVDPAITSLSIDQENPQFILPIVHNTSFEGPFNDPGWLDTHSSNWDWDDGTDEPGILTEENTYPDATGTTTAAHIYITPGNYQVSLTLTDDDGGIATDTLTVIVVDEFGALADLDDYIQSLPASAFNKNPIIRKAVFHINLMVIRHLLENRDYKGAMMKLTPEIRDKSDGFIDGNPKDDWIIDATAQQHVCMKVDDLNQYLVYLLENTL